MTPKQEWKAFKASLRAKEKAYRKTDASKAAAKRMKALDARERRARKKAQQNPIKATAAAIPGKWTTAKVRRIGGKVQVKI